MGKLSGLWQGGNLCNFAGQSVRDKTEGFVSHFHMNTPHVHWVLILVLVSNGHMLCPLIRNLIGAIVLYFCFTICLLYCLCYFVLKFCSTPLATMSMTMCFHSTGTDHEPSNRDRKFCIDISYCRSLPVE